MKQSFIILTIAGLLGLCMGQTVAAKEQEAKQKQQIEGLTYESAMEPEEAVCFGIDYYEGGYKLITVRDTDRYLVVPEGMAVPKNLPEDMTVLMQPLQNLYVAAPASMDSLWALEESGSVRFSASKKNSWYEEAVQEAMEDGSILYAGKYSEPDFELLLSEGCGLAVESTMIHHAPKAEEKLRELGIPVFVDQSSYEETPLGRTEWVRLYGALFNKEEEAGELFEAQKESVAGLKETKTDRTVAFFYFNEDGNAIVRNSDDYVVKMIELAGGSYAFELKRSEGQAKATVEMEPEQFYLQAKDADILIYSETMDEGFSSVEELVGYNALLGDFKAVQNGEVWRCGSLLLQKPTRLGDAICELNGILTGDIPEKPEFFERMERTAEEP